MPPPTPCAKRQSPPATCLGQSPCPPFQPCRGEGHGDGAGEGNTYIHSEYLLLFPKCKRMKKREKVN